MGLKDKVEKFLQIIHKQNGENKVLRAQIQNKNAMKEKILKLSESIQLLKHSNVALKTNMKVETDKFWRSFLQMSKSIGNFKPKVINAEIEKMKEQLLIQEQAVMSKKWAVEDKLRSRTKPKRNRYQ